MAMTPNGRKLSPLFSSWTLRPLFYSTSFFSYLPTSLISTLVSLLTGQSGPGSTTTTQLVSSPQTVVAAITMAAKEMEGVKELDRDLVKDVGGKCWWYWAEEGKDGWVREESIEEIEEVLGDGEDMTRKRERCKEGMPHAFVLNEGASFTSSRIYSHRVVLTRSWGQIIPRLWPRSVQGGSSRISNRRNDEKSMKGESTQGLRGWKLDYREVVSMGEGFSISHSSFFSGISTTISVSSVDESVDLTTTPCCHLIFSEAKSERNCQTRKFSDSIIGIFPLFLPHLGFRRRRWWKIHHSRPMCISF